MTDLEYKPRVPLLNLLHAFLRALNSEHRLRDQLLASEVFKNLPTAYKRIAAWKEDNDHSRPHIGVGT